jgi:hypothetical protein
LTYDTNKLYELLPAIYRIRDADQEKLRALISILSEQALLVEDDIDNLYNNYFIETCDEWVVPYIGDLLGVRNLKKISEKGSFSQRARIANTIGYRRRKGTAAMLEQLSRDTTGWNARAVEFFKLLRTTHHLNHIRLDNHSTPDVRKPEKLDLLDTPFDTIAHTCDVRHIATKQGRYNIPNIGIFLWRLQAYPVMKASAFSHKDGRFSFSPLGLDIRLFNHPVPEDDPGHFAEELNVPAPIRRLTFEARKESYYGEGKSIFIRKKIRSGDYEPVTDVISCNLEDWEHMLPPERIAVDIERGRIMFPQSEIPEEVEVSYYYGFSSEVGGGSYERIDADQVKKDTLNYPGPENHYIICKSQADAPVPSPQPEQFPSINEAIQAWSQNGKPDALFLIKDSKTYEEELNIEILEGRRLEIRADNGQRPVIRLKNILNISGKNRSQLTLNGLLIADEKIKVEKGGLVSLQIYQCTIAKGIEMEKDEKSQLEVRLDRSITGALYLENADQLLIQDSIIDGNNEGSEHMGIKCYEIVIERSTVLGKVSAYLIKLASNSIFTDEINAVRKQEGCIRFSCFSERSEVPRQYNCSKLKPGFTSINYCDPGYAQLDAQCPIEIREGADDEAEMGVFNHLKQPQREGNLLASLEEYMRLGLEGGIFYVT